jgi:protein-tyrosine phosphatase
MRALRPPRYHLSWLTSTLAVSRAPRRSDWKTIAQAGVTSVVDLRAELMDRGEHARRYRIEYLRLPIEEYTAPSEAVLTRLSAWIADRMDAGQLVLVFCREGRGRSPMVACSALLRQGWTLGAAYMALRRARPEASLNRAQDELLNRYAGTLAEALQPPKPAALRTATRRRREAQE